MKKLYNNIKILLLLVVSNTLIAQYNLNPNAPLNPVPIKFHKDHFFLNGPVKEYKQIIKVKNEEPIILSWTFNQEGYLVSDFESLASTVMLYQYDNQRLLSISYRSSYSTSVQEIVLDAHNRPLEKKDAGQVTNKYLYDNQGNLIKEFETNWISDSGTLFLSKKYTYDNQNRLIKEQSFNENGEMFVEKQYTYQTEGDLLKVSTSVNQKKPSVAYFKNGSYLGVRKNVDFDNYENPLQTGDVVYQYIYFSDEDKTITGSNSGSCISGNCQNGWGKSIYSNGDYEGFWKNGLKHGYGSYLWNTGDKYMGQWKEDKMTGFGIYTKNTDLIIGEFVNGKLHGLGFVETNNNKQQGVFVNDILSQPYYIFENNKNKTGCVTGDCKEKYGIYKWDNGDEFSGFWKNHNTYLGAYEFYNGDIYVGYFNQNGKRNGFGIYTYPTGSFYAGEWKDGKKHGLGYYVWDDGYKFMGNWKNDKPVKSLN